VPRKKRHHQVPRAYLERFASGGNVEVVRRDGGTFQADPINVAVESGFYDLPDGEGGKTQIVEDFFEGIEGRAQAVFAEIDRTGRPPNGIDNEDKAWLSLFLALQMSRTTHQREQILFPRRLTEWAAGRKVTKELLAEYLETEHLGFKPDDREVDGAWVYVWQHLQDEDIVTPGFAMQMMFDVAAIKTPIIAAMSWTVEVDPHRRFVTSDMPVIPWRKPSNRDHYEGLGFDKAEELRFPLDPGKQLVLSRRQRPSVVEVAVHRVKRANAEIASACHRFVVGEPGNPELFAHRLEPWRPVVRFWTGPLFMPGPDGELKKQPGDLMQMWTPRGAKYGRPGRRRKAH
jgi:uncharacterized protein DUF4238